MKLTKLSLIAAMLIGSSAFAIENTKISGDARLYYGTQDSDVSGAPSMFNKDASYTNFAAHLDLTTDLTKGVSAGVGLQVVSTLGVENNLVSSIWSGAQTARGNNSSFGARVQEAMWVDEAWLAGTAFDTTLKIGRQALDTPLAFTETWGVDKNTFEAVVLINQSLADTTLVATYIGNSNGSSNDTNAQGLAQAGYVAADGKFSTFGKDGVYAFGVVNNSIKPVTVQAWYYDLINLAEAYWLQADLEMGGILAGVQYANTELDQAILGDTSAYSLMLGYEMKDVVTIKVAYSDVDENGDLGVANTATGGNNVGAQSKLYTEMWWNYGNVSAVGAETYMISAEANMIGVDWFLGYWDTEIDPTGGANTVELNEITLTASKSYGPVDTAVAVIYANEDVSNVQTTDLQVYLTYNF